MFCPTCGINNSDQTRFCRSCGADLGLIADALSGKLLDLRVLEVEKVYQKDLFHGAIFVLILILTILATLKFAVGGINPEAFGPLIMVLSWMTAALFFTILLFARHRRKIRLLLLEKELGMPGGSRETAPLPEVSRIPLPSITEHTTTRLSEAVPAEERGRGDD
jgi:hypothetical protein